MQFGLFIFSDQFRKSAAHILSTETIKLLDMFDDLFIRWEKGQHSNDEDGTLIDVHEQAHLCMEQIKQGYIQDVLKAGEVMPIRYAQELLDQCTSVLRGRYLARLHPVLTESDWFKLFFDNWTSIEYGDEIIAPVCEIFQGRDMAQLMSEYATPQNYAEWLKLPDTVTVYRGCSENSLNGLSWSLDVETAKYFAGRRYDLFNGMHMKIRFITSVFTQEDRQHFANLKPEKVYVLVGEVSKKDLFLLLNRGEKEVFSTAVTTVCAYGIDSLEQLKRLTLDSSPA